MVRREIEIDENTDRMLNELASEYEGDLNRALADLVSFHEYMEDLVDQSEKAYGSTLRTLRDNAEADFREGRAVPWEQVKSANGL